MEEIEDIKYLDDSDYEVETVTMFNLAWTCPNCGYTDNIEFDIPAEGTVICECEECERKYQVYHCIY